MSYCFCEAKSPKVDCTDILSCRGMLHKCVFCRNKTPISKQGPLFHISYDIFHFIVLLPHTCIATCDLKTSQERFETQIAKNKNTDPVIGSVSAHKKKPS